jgi:hypothetical protein
MGQPLPLPKRIPFPPTKQVKDALLKEGVILELDDEGAEFVQYKLPAEWSMVDNSAREDMPEFHIVDNHNMIHFTISGIWKESYDNHIQIYHVTPPTKLQKKTQPMIPSETSSRVMLSKFAEAIDPLQQAQNPVEVIRKPQFQT